MHVCVCVRERERVALALQSLTESKPASEERYQRLDNFTVSEINDAPVAYDTTLDVPHDQLATLDIGWYSVYDADGDTVQLIIVDQAEHGEASANADGTVTFTPEANWTGTTSFTIQGNDGSADSNVASLDFHSTTVA